MENLEFKITEIPENQMYYEKIKLDAKEVKLEIEEVEFISPVECSVKLIKERNVVYASVETSVEVRLICRRCLKPYQTRISTHFDYQYEETDDPNKLKSEFLTSLDTRYYMKETLNLAEDVRQAIVLEIPVWPLCSEDCKGLCPVCGQDLNEGDCNCVVDIPAPGMSRPFANLDELLEDSEEKKEI